MKKALRFFGFASAILAIIAIFVLYGSAGSFGSESVTTVFSGYELIFGIKKTIYVFNASAGLITAFVILCLGVFVAVFISLSEIFFPNLSPKFPVYAIVGAIFFITSGILFFCAPNLISSATPELYKTLFTQGQAFMFAGILSVFAGALLGLRALFQIIK